MLAGVHALLMAFILVQVGGSTLPAIIVRPPKQPVPWKVFEEKDLEIGAIAPADTHVVFHVPGSITSIEREILLGQQGRSTRYWGYCLPQNYDEAVVKTRRGFPGQIFLSEAERRARLKLASDRQSSSSISPLRLPKSTHDLTPPEPRISSIRHQIEIFEPFMLCYLMTEKPLPIGLDVDGDNLNDALEQELGTDPTTLDSDQDGVPDGIEFRSGSNPALRDTDGDGLIDGIEDANWNGSVDTHETDPRVKDSDRDGVCDGICRIHLAHRDVFMGEDKNLNGKLDDGEMNPLNPMSCKKGYNDYIVFVNCLNDNKEDCPDACDKQQ